MSDADADFLIRQGGQMYSNATGASQANLDAPMTIYNADGDILGTLQNGYIYDSLSNTIGYVTGTSVYNNRSEYVGILSGNVIAR
jgi:hypothetical protein